MGETVGYPQMRLKHIEMINKTSDKRNRNTLVHVWKRGIMGHWLVVVTVSVFRYQNFWSKTQFQLELKRKTKTCSRSSHISDWFVCEKMPSQFRHETLNRIIIMISDIIQWYLNIHAYWFANYSICCWVFQIDFKLQFQIDSRLNSFYLLDKIYDGIVCDRPKQRI